MTSQWRLRSMLAAGFVASLLLAYCSGRKTQATADKLSSNKTAIHASDSSTKSVQIRTDSAHNRSDLLTDNRATIRPHVKVVHDTVTVDSSHVYVDSTLAQLIATDDSTIAAQARTIALQDTLIASLHVGLDLRDQRIKLLKSRGVQRFSKGIQLGAGYCATMKGYTPCGYLGYGLEVRIP